MHGGAFELLPVAPSLCLTIDPICDTLVPNHRQSLSMHQTKDPKTRTQESGSTVLMAAPAASGDGNIDRGDLHIGPLEGAGTSFGSIWCLG